ncbi:NAD-dependent epimerase/dehydratase family protein [Nanoarchaeota archaeon]
MKILVTGCAGYLGSHLCKKLIEEGHEITGMDILLYGEHSISNLINNIRFTLIRGDIRDINLLTNHIKGKDAVIHLASIVGAEASQLSPANAMIINTLATLNIAYLCSMLNVKRFVFASTASVYGSQGKNSAGLADERTEMIPIELYGQSKVKSEELIKDIFPDHTILRFGTLFGLSDRMRFDLVLNLFTAKAHNAEELTLYGGQQKRPLLHVKDAARAISHVLNHEIYGVYNVAHDNYSIEEISNKVKELIPCNVVHDEKAVDLRDYRISTEKVKRTGFNTGYSLEDGIHEIIQALRSGLIIDYKDPIYSNHAMLLNDKEAQRKAFTQGAITED